MLQRHQGYLFITLAVIELSLLPILSSVGASNIGTIPLLFLTFLTASVVSFAILCIKKRTSVLFKIISDKKALTIIIIAGLLNYAISQVFLTLGVLGAGPIVTSLILKLWPIFMALMLPFALKNRVKKSQFLALALGFIGIYVLSTQGTLSLSGNLHATVFILFIIISTLATAVSNIMIRAHNYDMYVQIFLFNLASFALFSILLEFGNSTAPFAGINTYGILSFLFLGGVTYSIGAFMFFYALKVLNPLFAGSATYATPLLTILFSTVLLGAQLHSYYFYALLFIFLALFIQQRQANKAPRYIPGRRYEGPSVLFDVTGVFIANRSNTVSNHIQGKGRALAAVVDKEWYANVDVKLLKDANVLIFTNDNLHPDISNEEIEFMNGILMPKNNELIMVGIGEPEAIEDAFNRVYYSAET